MPRLAAGVDDDALTKMGGPRCMSELLSRGLVLDDHRIPTRQRFETA